MFLTLHMHHYECRVKSEELKGCFKSSQTFSKGAQTVAPPIGKYARLKGPSFIDILPKFHDIWIYRTGVIAPKVTVCFCCRSENEHRTKS